MKGKLTKQFWAVMVVFSLTGQIAWVVENMYFNVFIYKMFRADADAISLMVALSAVTAALTTIFIGAYSDKVGKRKVFICLGYILWGVSIICFSLIRADVLSGIFPHAVSVASAGVSAVIVMDCVMTFFGSSANDACFNAWLTDSADAGTRGKVEGVNSMMPLMAILVVFGGFMGFDLDKPGSWTAIFLIIGILVIAIGILGFFFMEDSHVDTGENKNFLANLTYGFRPDTEKAHPDLYKTLLAFIIFGISIQIFMPYLILYYTVTLGLSNYVLIMAPAILLAAAATVFYGRLYDAAGFFRSVVPTILMLILGYLMLAFFTNTVLVFMGSLFMMTGYLTGMACFGAAIRDRTPENRTGMIQGVRIVSQVLVPGIIGPAIGAFVLRNADQIINDDGTKSFVPNANIYYAALIAAAVLLGLLVLFAYLKKKEVSNASGSHDESGTDRIQ